MENSSLPLWKFTYKLNKRCGTHALIFFLLVTLFHGDLLLSRSERRDRDLKGQHSGQEVLAFIIMVIRRMPRSIRRNTGDVMMRCMVGEPLANNIILRDCT